MFQTQLGNDWLLDTLGSSRILDSEPWFCLTCNAAATVHFVGWLLGLLPPPSGRATSTIDQRQFAATFTKFLVDQLGNLNSEASAFHFSSFSSRKSSNHLGHLKIMEVSKGHHKYPTVFESKLKVTQQNPVDIWSGSHPSCDHVPSIRTFFPAPRQIPLPGNSHGVPVQVPLPQSLGWCRQSSPGECGWISASL